MKSSKFIIPFLVSVLLTPVFLLAALASSGAGHGDYVWARILFPFTLLSAFLFDSITAPFIALGIVQFPFYGFLLGKANVRGQFLKYSILIALVHALAAIACFVL